MFNWVVYGKQKRYAITANEIALYTYPNTRKLHDITDRSNLCGFIPSTLNQLSKFILYFLLMRLDGYSLMSISIYDITDHENVAIVAPLC